MEVHSFSGGTLPELTQLWHKHPSDGHGQAVRRGFGLPARPTCVRRSAGLAQAGEMPLRCAGGNHGNCPCHLLPLEEGSCEKILLPGSMSFWGPKISVRNHHAGTTYMGMKSKHFQQAENRGLIADIETSPERLSVSPPRLTPTPITHIST